MRILKFQPIRFVNYRTELFIQLPRLLCDLKKQKNDSFKVLLIDGRAVLLELPLSHLQEQTEVTGRFRLPDLKRPSMLLRWFPGPGDKR
ncbi:MAG: hypothetical protein B6I22_11940 [Desulfobacteraceae bacterium 4572_123]|nr:MAG: hypothetical protein B6I22_11940 [Desulfobacteraceae bacterium 4572_123]